MGLYRQYKANVSHPPTTCSLLLFFFLSCRNVCLACLCACNCVCACASTRVRTKRSLGSSPLRVSFSSTPGGEGAKRDRLALPDAESRRPEVYLKVDLK